MGTNKEVFVAVKIEFLLCKKVLHVTDIINHSLAENNDYDCKDTSKGAVTYLPGNSSDNISSTPMIT